MAHRARTALIGAAGGVVLLVVVWFVVFHVGWVERKDQSVLRGFVDLQHRPWVSPVANVIAGLCDPKPYLFLGALPVLVALRRRRLWLAVAVGGLLLGANVTTQLLKPLLAQPRAAGLFGGQSPVTPASWPSGHATASMALALAWVLAVPGRLRPRVAAAGALFSVAVCYSFLTLEWHYPSDVLGGYLVAGIWTLLAIAGVLLVEHGHGRSSETLLARRRSTLETLGPAAAALTGVILLIALVVLARPRPVLDYASEHLAFVAGAGVIGLMALAVSTGISLMARRGAAGRGSGGIGLCPGSSGGLASGWLKPRPRPGVEKDEPAPVTESHFSEIVELPSHGRVFSEAVRPGFADCAPTGRARLDGLARWLQDVAYADVLDAGLAETAVWVVRRTRLRVHRFPRFGEVLRALTFCSGMGAMWAERRTTITRDQNAPPDVEAVALWVHLDRETWRPVPFTAREVELYGEPAGGRRVRARLHHPPPPPELSGRPWTFRATECDVADHVNNAAYWTPVEEELLLSGAAEPVSLDAEIEFRNPAQPGKKTVLSEGDMRWIVDPGGQEVHASVRLRPA